MEWNRRPSLEEAFGHQTIALLDQFHGLGFELFSESSSRLLPFLHSELPEKNFLPPLSPVFRAGSGTPMSLTDQAIGAFSNA